MSQNFWLYGDPPLDLMVGGVDCAPCFSGHYFFMKKLGLATFSQDMNSHYLSSDWAIFKHNNQPDLCMCKLNQ